MSAPSVVGVFIFTICLLVPVLTYALVKYFWNKPLQNGPGYFLGVEVPAGFYEGPGRGWMAGYHATVASLYTVWAVALGAIVIMRRWEMTPMWAGGFALLFVPTMLGFQAWTRHKLGVTPPVRPVALALESRRLGDYISWPLEALMVAVVGFSWWLLLRHAGAHFDWLTPLQLTWVALGLIPGKIVVVRSSSPLPTERTEEHYRYQDAERRNWLRAWGAFGWFFVVILLGLALGMALMRARSASRMVPGLEWLILGIAFAVWGYQVLVYYRGSRQLASMARDLRPAGSWRTPFRRASWMGMSRPYLIWGTIWCGGIFAFILYPLCKARF